MDFVVSIENATDYTPTLTTVTVTGADWVHTQELVVGQSFANHTRVVGMLDAGLPFKGTIVVHYTYVAPGPNGADVKITFSGEDLDGKPLVSYGYEGDAFPNTDAHLTDEDGSKILLVRIAG